MNTIAISVVLKVILLKFIELKEMGIGLVELLRMMYPFKFEVHRTERDGDWVGRFVKDDVPFQI